MDKEKIYTPKTKEQIKTEAIADLENLRKTIKSFKKSSEELIFNLFVMCDGTERMIKKFGEG